MSQPGEEVQIEGVIRASRSAGPGHGKQFLGVEIESTDGTRWVLTYAEVSPFHAFAERRVIAVGKPYRPKGQILFSLDWDRPLRHFRVSTMRLVEVANDAEFVQVGPVQNLYGRLDRGSSDSGEPALSFTTEDGKTFLIANDPHSIPVGHLVEVEAYPLERSPLKSRPGEQCLWVTPARR